MPIIRKRRIWWEPVPEATSYVVYVTPEKTLFEKNNFMWDAIPPKMTWGIKATLSYPRGYSNCFPHLPQRKGGSRTFNGMAPID